MDLRRAALLAVISFSPLACVHETSHRKGHERLNAPRCVTDMECGQDQNCVKEPHRPDGICK